jgi:hypothetical protein
VLLAVQLNGIACEVANEVNLAVRDVEVRREAESVLAAMDAVCIVYL